MPPVEPLIWMRPERASRGPKPTHSRGEIAAAAVRLADERGIDAVSMRQVAAEIGASTMSLYNYVSRKEDLIDLMVDATAGDYRLPDTPSGDWRKDLLALAHQGRALVHRHPWLPRAMTLRPTFALMGPNTLRYTEFVLAAVEDVLDGASAMELIGLLNGLVLSYVQSELAQAEAVRQAGGSQAEVHAGMAAYLGAVLASRRYPRFARAMLAGGAAAPDPDATFDRLVNRLLDAFRPAL